MKQKKRLTQQQEFEIMKLVLDKFLWLGFAIMAYGLYLSFTQGIEQIQTTISLIIAGAIVLLLFVWIIVKEYEIVK
ncbi:MAG TPA: hypothetical protein VJI75_04390 [Candidatus Nanoarchaeia archaeon]|nr:hypothetical protein [Candidatus Nanoarchaeia archaeon]